MPTDPFGVLVDLVEEEVIVVDGVVAVVDDVAVVPAQLHCSYVSMN
jgi:hypothetical protein